MVLNPKISIVTVAFNDAKNLALTLDRSIEQSYQNKEIIVIDGGSKDQSLDVIRERAAHLSFWCSEPDKGIYDAMNKGLKKAIGDWVIFMNAGDWFFDKDVLNKIFAEVNFSGVDFIYGNHEVRYPSMTRVHYASKDLDYLKFNNVFSHQTLFNRTEVLKKYPYNLKYKLVADFDSFYYHYLNGYKFKYVDSKISSILAGGISEQGSTAVLERQEIVLKQEKSLKIRFYYCYKIIRNWVGWKIKKNLPPQVLGLITSLKYRLINQN